MTKKKLTFKSAIRQIHLILGLTSGLVVFVIAIAAAILAFEEEGREAFQHDFYHVQAIGGQKASFKQMTDTVKAHYPKMKISSIRFKGTEDAAMIFYSKKDQAVSVDPYTSKIIGVHDLNKDFFTVVLALHTHLLIEGEIGEIIIKTNVLIFFIMCISGLILWWPKQKRFFKQAATINFKTQNWKRLNWDLHSVLGFYAMAVLTVVAFTGMFFAYDTVKSGVATITGSPKPKKDKVVVEDKGKKTFNVDKAYDYMTTNYPGAIETFITPPAGKTGAIRIQMRYPYTIVRQQNSVYFDPYTGEVIRADLYKNYNRYDVVAASNYNLHTGRFRVIGIGSKIIYFLVALIAASLPVTGFIIWLGKRKKKSKRGAVKRSRPKAVVTP